jgi:kynureninase
MEKGVFTDTRGDILRFGTAPYITTQQINKAMDELESVVSKISP